jgi:hypothetical protein
MLDSPLDIAQQVGVFGTQVSSVDVAIPAVRPGDGDAVAQITAEIRGRSTARAAGQQRMVAGGSAALLLLAVLAVLLVRRARQASCGASRPTPGRHRAAEAHQRPVPLTDLVPSRTSQPADDTTTQVWLVPIVPSDTDADLARSCASAQPPPGPPPPPGR